MHVRRMRWSLLLPVLGLALALGAPAAEAQTCSLSVDIYGPDSKCTEGDVTLVATPSSNCAIVSCSYAWYYKWCEDSTAPNNCPSSWYLISGATSDTLTKKIYSFDIYVDFKVEVTCELDCNPPQTLTAVDTHRVWGPQSTLCGGSGGGGPL